VIYFLIYLTHPKRTKTKYSVTYTLHVHNYAYMHHNYTTVKELQ